MLRIYSTIIFFHLFFCGRLFAQPEDLYIGTDEHTTGHVQRYQPQLTPRCGSGKDGDSINDDSWVYYRAHSKMKLWDGPCVNGKLHGTWTQYYLDRPWVYIECEYRNGQRNGSYKKYSRLGSVVYEAHYKNDSLDGYERFYDGNGVKTRQTFYVNGKKHGLSFVIHKGDTTYSEHFINGIPTGTGYELIVRDWYPNKIVYVKTITVYADGKIESIRKTLTEKRINQKPGNVRTDTVPLLTIEKTDSVRYRFVDYSEDGSSIDSKGYCRLKPENISLQYHSARLEMANSKFIPDSLCICYKKSSINKADSVKWLYRGVNCIWRDQYDRSGGNARITHEEYFPAGLRISKTASKLAELDTFVTTTYTQYALASSMLVEKGIPKFQKKYFAPGKIKEHTTYDSIGRVDVMRGYYRSGNDSIYGFYSTSINHMVYYYYRDQKNPEGRWTKREEYNILGVAEGTWEDYDELGRLKRSCHFKDGEQSGEETWYDFSINPETNDYVKTPLAHGYYEHGKKSGSWEEHLPDGTWMTGQYKDGFKEGLWEEWYEKDKQRKSAGQYLRGVRKGKWIVYDRKGKKLNTFIYQ